MEWITVKISAVRTGSNIFGRLQAIRNKFTVNQSLLTTNLTTESTAIFFVFRRIPICKVECERFQTDKNLLANKVPNYKNVIKCHNEL